ncbi:MAG: hypothetical protein Q4B58_03450, partial [Bacteroidales bacterium]|nr:hypothetical protein [Bacteroidales bacterium]
MKIYFYKYITDSSFAPAIIRHAFKLRATACNNEIQHVVEPRLEVFASVGSQTNLSVPVFSQEDGLGNQVQWGFIAEPHDCFRFVSSGQVVQSLPYRLNAQPELFYLAPTSLTNYTKLMRQLANACSTPEDVMHAVHNLIIYTPCHTTVSTTAQEVWNDPRGV